MSYEVLHADYHRNGVGGAGFFVGLVHDSEEQRDFLVTWFPQYEEDGDTLQKFQENIAVIDPAQAATGNVYMHPTGDQPGGNAWRGDHYGDAARAMQQLVRSRYPWNAVPEDAAALAHEIDEACYETPPVVETCQGRGGHGDPRCGRDLGHAGQCDWSE